MEMEMEMKNEWMCEARTAVLRLESLLDAPLDAPVDASVESPLDAPLDAAVATVAFGATASGKLETADGVHSGAAHCQQNERPPTEREGGVSVATHRATAPLCCESGANRRRASVRAARCGMS